LPENWNQIPAAEIARTKPFVVDVRDPEDYAKGFIAGAVNIPLRQLAASLEALPGIEKPTVLVCNSGYGAAVGMTVLRLLGYKDVETLEGGMQAWQRAKLPVVTSPVPQRTAGDPPQVDRQLQAALDYYLTHTLPVEWGAISPTGLTDDQKRKSSAELEAQADTYDQGRSLLIDVDAPGEFADAKLTKSVNVPLRGLPDGLASMRLAETISWACGVPDNFRPEPELTRFVMVSTSGHRAAIGMVSMQLLGFHFIRGLDDDVKAWSATTDAVVR
jgi:rhodanese-related sulfurtransferase